MHHEHDLVTLDDDKVGHIVGEENEYYLVEHGIRKTKHAVPKTFAHVDDGEKTVRLSVSKEIVETAPKVGGEKLDEQAVAEHYGLASAYEAPETLGAGEVLPDDPGRTAEDDALRAGIPTAEQERLRVMKEDDPATQQESPGLLGDRNPRN